jgi:hypothetical protein
MALTACVDQVCLVDGGMRIARRENVVYPMATGTIGHDLRAQLGGEAVIARQVGGGPASLEPELLRQPHAFMAARAGRPRQVLGGDGGIRINVRLDGVNAMAISTDWRLRISAGDRLPVDAPHELLLDGGVAFGTGDGHVELENGRLWIARRQNLVRTVAIGADGGLLGACCHGASVHAFPIGEEWLRTVPAGFHHELLAVARATGDGDVGMVDSRFGIARRQKFVRAAVAVDTSGCLAVSRLDCLGMEAALVRGLLISVAGSTGDLGWRGPVRRGLEVGVAIHAGKHAAVDRILELVRVDVKTDSLAVDHFTQRRITVTGQTVFVGGFLCGSTGPGEQAQSKHQGRQHLAQPPRF